ncbi:serine protease [Clavibacter sp. VKM Ac-2542]|uniref:trypsin-like serine peptidase n=1 Tax=Clavibacter sp. VKM Ac-2542 TaxID=2783811 RepID=UPI00188D6F35|nr:serine protease [Clavibacter sp. VKM Ac-2542]MBF4619556.1 serine protease [Clavibacter sp. VKM Ac-2542]
MTHRPAHSTRRRTAVVSAVCLGAALIGVAAPASALDRGAPSAAVDPSLVSVTVPAGQASAAVAYWTPERRAAATAGDGSGDTPTGPRVAASDTATPDAVASDATGTGGHAEQVATVPHMGRIYYMQEGFGHYCSANVVASANGSTISTAGHCTTMHQVFSTDMVFYPQYESGGSVYGAWPVVGGNVTTGWYQQNDADQAEDSAFMAVARDSDGETVASVVGASPVLFDQPAAQLVSAFGYPAAGRFDGEHLDRCTGSGTAQGTAQIVLACDMTGGVSGGPILLGDGSDGAQFANVAERDDPGTHNIGPLWQDSQHSAYDLTAAIAT